MIITRILHHTILILIAISIAFAQKEEPPEGSKPKDFKLPEKQVIMLENGLKVTMVLYGALPKVAVRFVSRVGNINELAGETWIADLTMNMLKEGTKTRSTKDIAQEAAQMGGEVTVSVGLDRSWVGGNVLSEYAPDLIELIADIMQNPSFPEKEFERLKRDFLRRLTISKSQPGGLAQEKFLAVLYPDHPYGQIFPSEDALKNYNLEQIKGFYQENFGAQRVHVYVVGKFNAVEVEKKIKEVFTAWPKGPEPLIKLPKAVSERKIYLVDRPGAPQSTIYLGLPVIDPSHSEYIAMLTTNTLLGGYFSSRITTNIRENKGYTYSPLSSINSHYRDAYWVQQADVTTNVTGASLKEIFYEIDRLQNEVPSKEELKGVQNYVAGTFIRQNSSQEGIINLIAFIDFHDLGKDYLKSYIKNIFGVTPEQVQKMAQKYLKDESMTIVIVGDKNKVPKQVKKYASIVY